MSVLVCEKSAWLDMYVDAIANCGGGNDKSGTNCMTGINDLTTGSFAMVVQQCK